MNYETWRATFQNSEQAARAAFDQWQDASDQVADQVDYPDCDTCGKSMDYMPWHYAKGDDRHLHACDECWPKVDPANQPGSGGRQGVPEQATDEMLEACMSDRDRQHPANAKRYLQYVWQTMVKHLPASPQIGGGGWMPAHGMSDELPEIGKPVLGYHPDWVDADFCADGIRECFLFGDGTEWQSARWDGYSDQWIAEDGAPEFWQEHPQPPTEG